MRVHFIAIGGAAMHNLALALHKKGFKVSGSDDEIFDPSKSRLEKYGLLPEEWGWFPNKITSDIDAIILGMHARIDNPELLKAKELGLKIYSYPEYIYEQTKDKTRVVIGGSHGKTTTTSMIMHVLKCNQIDFDYMVGAQIEGFDTMVKLSEDAKIAVFEGDEYLASPIDPRPKFHLYHPHIALLTGIAWDHINVFPTFENYLSQFETFINFIKPGGSLIYFENDQHIAKMVQKKRDDISYRPYKSHPHKVDNGISSLITKNGEFELSIFGEHNLQNLQGAYLICKELGLSDEQFYSSIKSFGGAAKRLQKLAQNKQTIVYQDFAHSPSKLEATTQAVKNQFPDRKLIACMELHTFSSLKEEFLPEYNGSMSFADVAMVYFNPKTVEHKKLTPITIQQVQEAFGGDNLKVYTDSQVLLTDLMQLNFEKTNLLLMSSGNFSGLNLKEVADKIIMKA
ncbi:UDP-N-acetylmuramate: L-alanyl-gamma-D-glutamyl-meso-diaminopimelate ligase [Ancylomarina subtilis]|uniref:UDP-N-acetylmuramate: L-alanyl-gamma-D-glutamyl-meso-diaminopimelate ligase n=1 Tax=Ancylomarina subtilis TaxID=1639035 RepID=A0A4Q7VMG2_9BACT|nr:Mur ligase family protein [Ancylomarina subtilis]RZT97503.1 UDP-N-acetylmuramate: L-alanyl-gamma-D-glutamyl-meso-diaminopimelate ligase [Ancylomarina subtilis]